MYTGLTGAIKIIDNLIDTVTVAHISGWSIEDKTDIVETIRLDSVYKGMAPSFQSWSASANGTVSFEDTSSHGILFAAKSNGKKIKLMFFLNNVADEKTYFEGDANRYPDFGGNAAALLAN